MKNVEHLLLESAQRFPDKPMIVDAAGSISYSAAVAYIQNLKGELSDYGIREGSLVGLHIADGRNFVLHAFAIMGLGGVMVPLADQMADSEILEVSDGIGLEFVVSDRVAMNGSLESRPVKGGPVVHRLASKTRDPISELVPNAAYIRFTSGTTGAAKGIALSHETIFERTEAGNRGLGIGPEETVLCVLPMAFHFIVSIVLYIRYGATLVVMRDVSGDGLLDAANEHGATFIYGSPLHYRVLASESSGRRFTTVRRCVSTSSSLAGKTAADFLERFGIPVAQAYGIIEVGLPMINLADAEAHPDSIGSPIAGFEVSIVDESFQPVADGEVGELLVRGPGMFDAYILPPRKRADALHDGWFATGDLARRDSHGRVYIVGRSKSTINVAGNKVFPEEVEAVLALHAAVEKSRVYGKQHVRFGELVVADVVSTDRPSVEELLNHCRKHLSPYKVPQFITFVDSIDETLSGKIRRI